MLDKVQSGLMEDVTQYTKKRMLLTCVRRYIRSRLTLAFARWIRTVTFMVANEQGVLAQTKKDKVLLLVRLRRERRKEWYVLMIHVGGTRCVTSSTDNIMKIRARITLIVEFIRGYIFIFLFYV